jgi:tRNA(Phe) wybutosine-synthesizing methylase Tyw3
MMSKEKQIKTVLEVLWNIKDNNKFYFESYGTEMIENILNSISTKMIEGIDEDIRHLVDVLNKNGFDTVASCSGHGKMMGNIALKDGREIMIIENYDKARKIEQILISEGLYQPISPINLTKEEFIQQARKTQSNL